MVVGLLYCVFFGLLYVFVLFFVLGIWKCSVCVFVVWYVLGVLCVLLRVLSGLVDG